MNINKYDFLLATNIIFTYDEDKLSKQISPFEIFQIVEIYDNMSNIIIFDRKNNWFEWTYIKNEDLVNNCVKLNVEEV